MDPRMVKILNVVVVEEEEGDHQENQERVTAIIFIQMIVIHMVQTGTVLIFWFFRFFCFFWFCFLLCNIVS